MCRGGLDGVLMAKLMDVKIYEGVMGYYSQFLGSG